MTGYPEGISFGKKTNKEGMSWTLGVAAAYRLDEARATRTDLTFLIRPFD